jgi:hypothetical protein
MNWLLTHVARSELKELKQAGIVILGQNPKKRNDDTKT